MNIPRKFFSADICPADPFCNTAWVVFPGLAAKALIRFVQRRPEIDELCLIDDGARGAVRHPPGQQALVPNEWRGKPGVLDDDGAGEHPVGAEAAPRSKREREGQIMDLHGSIAAAGRRRQIPHFVQEFLSESTRQSLFRAAGRRIQSAIRRVVIAGCRCLDRDDVNLGDLLPRVKLPIINSQAANTLKPEMVQPR